MANAIIAYGNQIDGATLSGGAWATGLPLSNLKDRRIARLARSAAPDPSSTTFDIDFGEVRLLRVFGLVGHNFTTGARYRIQFSNTPGFGASSILEDTGEREVWPIVYPAGSLPWGSPSWWTGRYSDADIAGYNASVVCTLETAVAARYVRVSILDQTNPAGYVQIGRVFAANGWQPVRNIVYGASLGWENRTTVQEADSGAEYFDIRRSARVARFGLEAMTEAEAMTYAFEIQRTMGVSGELLFIWDPDDTAHALRRQFLCRLRTLSPIENPGPNRWRSPFEVKELL